MAFLLIREGHVLAERRKLSKVLLPGAIALPGGHMEADETPVETLMREVYEELGVHVSAFDYVCTLLDRVNVVQEPEGRRLHYFGVWGWEGEIGVHEADEVVWIPLDAPDRLVPYVDRLAVAELIRLYPS